MKKALVLFLLAGLVAGRVCAAKTTTTVAFAQTPPVVQKTIQTQLGGGKLGAISREEEDGDVNFEVEMTTRDGQERSFTVDQDGTLASIEVTLAETPAAVQKTVTVQVGAGKLEGIDKTFDDGEVGYEVVMTTKDGRERSFTVDQDGTLTSIEVTLAETPATVQKTVTTQVGAGKLESIEKTFDAGEVSYEVMMKTREGQAREFTVEENGTLASVEVALAETPAPVQKTVTAQVGTGKLEKISKVFDDQDITYEAEMTTADGKGRDFTVGAKGKLLSVQVILDELAPDVQKTIKEQIGAGRIVRIAKSFELKKKVQPYEVEGRKDGKPFNFSVGPQGRFLGRDE